MSYICDRCGKGFTTKRRLQTHKSKKIPCVKMKIMADDKHLDKNVKICDPDRSGSIRINPITGSSIVKQYACKYCGKTFTLNSNRIRHQRYRCQKKGMKDCLYVSDSENSSSDDTLMITNDHKMITKDHSIITNDHKIILDVKTRKVIRNEQTDIRNDTILCEYCGKIFSYMTNKIRHEKHYCKFRRRNDILDDQQKQLNDKQKTINLLQDQLDKKDKKIEKKDDKLKRVYTEKEVLGKAVNNYNFVFEACKNSRDLRCPVIEYNPQIPMIGYTNEHDVEDEIDTENDTENEVCLDDEYENEDDNNIEQIVGLNSNDIIKEDPVVKFVEEQVEFYVNLGARNGITTMIRKLIVDNMKIIDRGAWCIDPNRSNFIIKSNGMMFQDRNGQDLLSIIMPGIEKIFFDDLSYWSNKLQAEGYTKSTGTIENLCKRQTFVREMRDKVVRKHIAHDIGAPLYADRKKIVEQLKQENFDNINIIFDDTPIKTHDIEEID